jgi:hypothetical protein
MFLQTDDVMDYELHGKVHSLSNRKQMKEWNDAPSENGGFDLQIW